jgi:hypothetical protein
MSRRHKWTKDHPGIKPGDGDPRHGTLNGYTNLCCRCDQCRSANTDYYAIGDGSKTKWKYRERLIAEGLTSCSPIVERTRSYRPRPSMRRGANPQGTNGGES